MRDYFLYFSISSWIFLFRISGFSLTFFTVFFLCFLFVSLLSLQPGQTSPEYHVPHFVHNLLSIESNLYIYKKTGIMDSGLVLYFIVYIYEFATTAAVTAPQNIAFPSSLLGLYPDFLAFSSFPISAFSFFLKYS